MKYSSIPVAQTVIYHCKANGIKNIVISPGSRNAPLIIGFTSDSFFSCFSIVDERCAAFFALGIAQQLKEPVVVVCTSGSALLNYYPAVAEAFYSNIPLIVISADRPEHKIDIGDGQTIRQQHVFKNHIGCEVNLKLDISHVTSKLKVENPILFQGINSVEEEQKKINTFNEKELHKGLRVAIEKSCPIHINAPFEESLYDVSNELSFIPSVQNKVSVKKTVVTIGEEFVNLWNAASKKIVLVGVLGPNEVEQHFLDALGTDPSVIVLTETTSNLHHPNFFTSIDSVITPIEKSKEKEHVFQALQPDILLTFGGLIVSKKIKSFLRTYPPKHHWHVDAIKANNTFFCLSQHFKVAVNTFLNSFSKGINSVESSYFKKWALIKNSYLEKRETYLKEIPFSDFQAFSILFKSIPKNYQLQLANSSTVRYAQLFDLDPSLTVFCNRGTSGIDGSTSTAVGAALYKEMPTLLVTGDLSFFYDSNGLWNTYIRSDFRIILINNSGGGIFRILPGHEETPVFENYFETAHNRTAKELCRSYKIDYQTTNDSENLNLLLSEFYKETGGPKLLEIKTPRHLNNKILLNYFDFITLEALLINKVKDTNKL